MILFVVSKPFQEFYICCGFMRQIIEPSLYDLSRIYHGILTGVQFLKGRGKMSKFSQTFPKTVSMEPV